MNRKSSCFIPTTIALLTLFFILSGGSASPQKSDEILLVRVVRVHDGDTVSVLIGKSRERVRLIGIDAPELGQRPWGARAKKRLQEMLNSAGRTVAMEFDVDRRDKYGRLLAYLWTGGRRLINLEMVRDGYAVLFTFPPNIKHVDELRKAQRFARDRRLGIWGTNGLKEMPVDYRRKHPF